MRWISGFIIAAFVITGLFTLPAEVIQAVVVILSVVGCWEFFRMRPQGVSPMQKILFYILCALATAGFIYFHHLQKILVLILVALLIVNFLFHFRGQDSFEERVVRLAYSYFSLMYCVLLFGHLALLRNLEHWEFWVFLAMACTFSSDTGAYVFGKTLGKHKMSPKLSPGKTIEGLVGGSVVAIGAAFVVREIFLPDFSVFNLIAIATTMSLIGPLGDLSESLIKRGLNAKDSSQLIPGHGGILDRLDALLFNAPIVYYFAKFVGF